MMELSAEEYMMFETVKSGNLDAVKKQLPKIKNLNIVNAEGNSLIIHAILTANHHIANFLTDAGVDTNIVNKNHETAFTAIKYDTPLKKNLLAHNAKINHQNADGETSLMRINDEETLKLELENGADTKLTDNHKRTALHFYAKKGYDYFVHTMVKHGAFLDALDENGNTPAMTALLNNQESFAIAAFDAGADFTIPNKDGLTVPDMIKSGGFYRLQTHIEKAEKDKKLNAELAAFIEKDKQTNPNFEKDLMKYAQYVRTSGRS